MSWGWLTMDLELSNETILLRVRKEEVASIRNSISSSDWKEGRKVAHSIPSSLTDSSTSCSVGYGWEDRFAYQIYDFVLHSYGFRDYVVGAGEFGPCFLQQRRDILLDMPALGQEVRMANDQTCSLLDTLLISGSNGWFGQLHMSRLYYRIARAFAELCDHLLKEIIHQAGQGKQ